jgi:hypothetical protein
MPVNPDEFSGLTRYLLAEATLEAADMVALRFLTAALLLTPHALSRGLPVRHLSPLSLLAIVGRAGFAFSLCNTGGLVFAPAGHSGAMTAPLSAVFTGLLAHFVLGEGLSRRSVTGLGLLLAGVATLVGATLAGHSPRLFIGHALLACAGLLFALYTIAMRRARLAALDAVAISAFGSVLVYMPPYLLLFGPRFLAAPNGGGGAAGASAWRHRGQALGDPVKRRRRAARGCAGGEPGGAELGAHRASGHPRAWRGALLARGSGFRGAHRRGVACLGRAARVETRRLNPAPGASNTCPANEGRARRGV